MAADTKILYVVVEDQVYATFIRGIFANKVDAERFETNLNVERGVAQVDNHGTCYIQEHALQ